jgi:hypothetical protein
MDIAGDQGQESALVEPMTSELETIIVAITVMAAMIIIAIIAAALS